MVSNARFLPLVLQITPTMENPHVLEDIEEIVREEGIVERGSR